VKFHILPLVSKINSNTKKGVNMPIKITVVGVGMVGDQIISILKERNFPVEWPPRVCATRKRTEILAGERFSVEAVSDNSFENADIVLFAGKEGARGAAATWRKTTEAAGAICIDNGKDFRLDPDVPLIVPEINLGDLKPEHQFIASPNCSTTQMGMVLAPIRGMAGIRRVVVSTYQSVSGWGVRANQELLQQQSQAMESPDSVTYDPTIMAHPIALNYFPHIDKFAENGYTGEEMKMIQETRKILNDCNLQITATAVRVPALVGHGESINIETEQKITTVEAREVLAGFPGVIVLDHPNPGNPREDALERTYPSAMDIDNPQHKDSVLVGRIREDPTISNGLNLWCVADNLRKGAALNVVQICEGLIESGRVRIS